MCKLKIVRKLLLVVLGGKKTLNSLYKRSSEGRRSSAEAEVFSPSAMALAAEGLEGRRPKFL